MEALVKEARVQSGGRAASLLDAMASSKGVPLQDLARNIGVAKSTAFYLVGALVDDGLAARDSANGLYRRGLLNLVYGRAVKRRVDRTDSIRLCPVRLCAETRETVNLAMPSTTDAIVVESLESNQTLRVSFYAEPQADHHATAYRRALIAWRSEAHRKPFWLLDRCDQRRRRP